ncbi:MAG: hypothetical protein JO101_12300, partial [Candidatus Eremiobacteraeota bacterium]|nr:hypothetical protein [Candidatus Eremiobacteraeota bacterium]
MIVLDSITHVDATAEGQVVVAASHGAIYPAAYAGSYGVAAVVLNDASVGKDGAGISGLAFLDRYAIPAATVDYESARIGDGRDTYESGRISHVNQAARALGCIPGLACREAIEMLARAAAPASRPPKETEARRRLVAGPPEIWALDSVSLVQSDDRERILVTGSHGGLLAGRPETALKHDALAALYN